MATEWLYLRTERTNNMTKKYEEMPSMLEGLASALEDTTLVKGGLLWAVEKLGEFARWKMAYEASVKYNGELKVEWEGKFPCFVAEADGYVTVKDWFLLTYVRAPDFEQLEVEECEWDPPALTVGRLPWGHDVWYVFAGEQSPPSSAHSLFTTDDVSEVLADEVVFVARSFDLAMLATLALFRRDFEAAYGTLRATPAEMTVRNSNGDVVVYKSGEATPAKKVAGRDSRGNIITYKRAQEPSTGQGRGPSNG